MGYGSKRDRVITNPITLDRRLSHRHLRATTSGNETDGATACSLAQGLQNLFLEQGRVAALHFLWRQGFQMATEQPFMAERIAHGA